MSRLGKNARFGPSRRNFNRPAQWRRATVDAAHDRRPTMVNHIAARSSSAGRATVTLGILLFAHAAYSTYEFVAQGKSLAPGTLSTPYEKTIPWDVTIETLLSFMVLAFGCAMTTPALREIDWSAELRDDSIDRVYARPSFANVRHRGAALFGDRG
ncbi:hypothetical protein GLX27_000160 [Malassezia furfur]|uniref:Membrane magnesium transporter n=1 Tax=Malassezia furfur TaxID=55194 RepID=A0ABY8EKE1_MALFU|nr:hypothetical protein GLX27_000160 [Malassezia furfur]